MRRVPFLLFFLLSANAVAKPVIHRCVSADGEISYQQTPCPTGSVDTREIAVRPEDVRPAPEQPMFVPPQDPPQEPPTPLRPPEPPPQSFRCATADGTVFYRHGGCPAQLSVRQPYLWVGETQITLPVFVPVQAQPIPRESACSAIYDRGASRRDGSEHDERYSVYQRATGRDPCR